MADEPNWEKKFPDESRGRPASGGVVGEGAGSKHVEYWEKKQLEREQTLTRNDGHTTSPQAGGMPKSDGPGTIVGMKKVATSDAGDLFVTEQISIHGVKFDDGDARRKGPEGSSVHDDARQLAGFTR